MRLLLSLLFVIPLCAQDQPPAGGRPPGRTPPAPKNLKVLKLEPGQSIGALMRTYTVALGVKCDYCHVQGDFSSDDNPKKTTARMMITMAQEVNGKFADAKEHVTCYTCHRGEPMPKTAPPPAAPAAQ